MRAWQHKKAKGKAKCCGNEKNKGIYILVPYHDDTFLKCHHSWHFLSFFHYMKVMFWNIKWHNSQVESNHLSFNTATWFFIKIETCDTFFLNKFYVLSLCLNLWSLRLFEEGTTTNVYIYLFFVLAYWRLLIKICFWLFTTI